MTIIKKLLEKDLARLILSLLLFIFLITDSEAQINGPVQVCASVTYIYSVEGFGRPSWTITGGTITSGSGTSTVTVQWSNASSRHLDVRDVRTDDPPSTLYVTTYSGPTGTGGSTCLGGSAQLSASGGTSYQWYTSAGSSIPGATGNVYNTPALSSNTNYFVSRIISPGCESAGTLVTATINPGPAAPNAFGFSTNQQCGVTILTAPVAPAGVTYYWESDANGTSISNASSTYSTNNNVTVYLRGRNSSGCWGSSTQQNIIVYSAPLAPPQPTIQQLCRSVKLTPLAPPPSIVMYYWQTSSTGTSTSNLAASANPITGVESVYPKTVTTAGTYYLRAQGTLGCWSAPTTITVSSLPNSLSCLEGQGKNFVVSNVILKEGVKTEAAISALAVEDNSQTISYADGFGRVIQSVGVQQSPSRQDVVQFHVYDQFGREPKKYLPLTISNDGRYKQDALTAQSTFYASAQATPDRRATSTTPWAETVFESSPLNRVKEQGFAGEAWQIGTTHTVKSNIKINTANEVRMWDYDFVSGQITSPGYYGAGELIIEETIDEHGNKSWSYQNKLGQTVLTKKEASSTTTAQTYYVFDSFSRLRAVIQPQGVAQVSPSGTVTLQPDFIKAWCFTYRYDAQGRMSEKQTPGSGTVYLVYNKRDQVILTQDANERAERKWSFVKYDSYSRPVLNGIYTHQNIVTQEQMQAMADGVMGQYESRSSVNYATQFGYTIDQSFPTSATGSLLIETVTHYDDYNFDNNTSTTDASYIASGLSPEPVASPDVVNKVTGTRVRVLDTNQLLLSVNFYDKRGNLIQMQLQNHLGGNDVITSTYDFSGKVRETKRVHKVQANSEALTVRKINTYDHAGRRVKLQQQINTGPLVTISAVSYNELGQSVEKKLHGTGSTYFQTVDYRYNIRSWLSSINDAALSDPEDFFGEELRYNETPISQPASSNYNGNITETVSRQYNDKPQAYVFNYDKLDRLTDAHYSSKNVTWIPNGFDEDGINYDLNGNITALTRYELPAGQSTRQKIDGLSYNYNGNQLTKVEDTQTVPSGFLNGANEAQEYLYDANGNLTQDKNKKIRSIEYNHLNLVKRVVMDSVEIAYGYTSAGTKVSKTVIRGNNTTVHDYINGFEYENDTLQFFATEEGRVIKDDSAGYVYQYNLTDHLGNVRVTFTTRPEVESARATMENTNTANEQSEFLYYTEAVIINSPLFDHTNQGPTFYSTRLNGTKNERTGLARSLSVMAGDTINAEVYVKYLDTNSSNWSAALTDFIASIVKGTAPAGTFIDGGAAGSTGGVIVPFAGLLDKSRDIGMAPKAYLNYLVFDRNFNFLIGGYERVTNAAREYGQDGAHEKLSTQVVITQPGYVFIYLSNDNDQPVEVYFDDFSVEQVNSPIIETNGYYPYGLTFNSYRRENATPNLYQFNGKEVQPELGAGAYDFGARMYGAQIGRWHVIDPLAEKYMSFSQYNYALNNPMRFVDLDGREDSDVVNSFFQSVRMIRVEEDLGFMDFTGRMKQLQEGLDDLMTAMGYIPVAGPAVDMLHADAYSQNGDEEKANQCRVQAGVGAVLTVVGEFAAPAKLGAKATNGALAIGVELPIKRRAGAKIALGVEEHIDDFVKGVGEADVIPWTRFKNNMNDLYKILRNPNTKIFFNLRGLEDVQGLLKKVAETGGRGISASRDLAYVFTTPEMLLRTDFYIHEASLAEAMSNKSFEIYYRTMRLLEDIGLGYKFY